MSFNEANLGERRMILLAPTVIGAAVGPIATTPKTDIGGTNYLIVEGIFLYGAGGTTVKAWIQTSVDGGLSWFDIINLPFTTAAANQLASIHSAVSAGTAPFTPTTDGTSADNTVKQGYLGDRIRVKYLTTGIYTGATSLAIYAIAKA